MDALIFAANIMYVTAYFTTDMLRLRMLTVTGAVFLAVYFYAQPEPFWSVIGWNLFFVILNMFQIVRIIKRRRMKKDGGEDRPQDRPQEGLKMKPTPSLSR